VGNDVLNILKEINSLKKGQVQIQMGKVQELDKKELAHTLAKDPKGKKRKVSYTKQIEFSPTFKSKPDVHVGLSYIDADTARQYLRINAGAEKVTKSGVLFKISTWNKSKIYGFRAEWIAIQN
jgi:hypothetical protein